MPSRWPPPQHADQPCTTIAVAACAVRSPIKSSHGPKRLRTATAGCARNSMVQPSPPMRACREQIFAICLAQHFLLPLRHRARWCAGFAASAARISNGVAAKHVPVGCRSHWQRWIHLSRLTASVMRIRIAGSAGSIRRKNAEQATLSIPAMRRHQHARHRPHPPQHPQFLHQYPANGI